MSTGTDTPHGLLRVLDLLLANETRMAANVVRELIAEQQPVPSKPVAWRWHWKGGDEPDVWGYQEHKPTDRNMVVEPLFASSEKREPSTAQEWYEQFGPGKQATPSARGPLVEGDLATQRALHDKRSLFHAWIDSEFYGIALTDAEINAMQAAFTAGASLPSSAPSAMAPHCPGLDKCLKAECATRCAIHGEQYIKDVSIPLLEAISEPCKGCGKRPIDFMEGASTDGGATNDQRK